jgi:hypothetical protein
MDREPLLLRLNQNPFRLGVNVRFCPFADIGFCMQMSAIGRETTPEEFGSFVRDKMELWGKVVKEAIRLG